MTEPVTKSDAPSGQESPTAVRLSSPARLVALIPVAIGLNLAMGTVVAVLKIPYLYLDSIGTVAVALLAGPLPAALTGGLGNLIWGLTYDPVAIPFALTAIAIGLTSGVLARGPFFRDPRSSALAGLIIGVVATLVSTPIVALLFGGVTTSGSTLLIAALRATGQGLWSAVFQGSLFADLVDKLLTALLAYYLVAALPPSLRSRFGRHETTGPGD